MARPTNTITHDAVHGDAAELNMVASDGKIKKTKGITRKKWQTRTRWACVVLCCCLGLLLLVAGVLVLLHFRDLVKAVVASKVPLRSDSDVTKKWMKPPIRPLLRLYFFNVTNPQDFLKGEKPKLQEVGPYVYSQVWEKTDVTWHREGQEVEYSPKKTFFFERELSVGPESDVITLPNVPMLSGLAKERFSSKHKQVAINAMLVVFDQKPFVELSVKEVIWGYDSNLVKLANEIADESKKLPSDKFGFFVEKNNTSLGVIRALTGILNVNDIGQVISFNRKTSLDFWKTDECNAFNGTDGSVFHPNIAKTDVLRIFNRDLCRSLPLVFQKEVKGNGGIPGYRFVPPPNVFARAEDNPENECFCVRDDGCGNVPSGLFDLSPCQFDAPILLSWPHFFQADPALLDQVDGLHPDPEKHQFFIDVQPNLGTGLRAAARTQINVAMYEMPDYMRTAKGFRDIIFPVVWFQDGIDGIDDVATNELLSSAVLGPEQARSVLYPALFAIGFILVISSVAFCLAKRICISGSQQPKKSSSASPAAGDVEFNQESVAINDK